MLRGLLKAFVFLTAAKELLLEKKETHENGRKKNERGGFKRWLLTFMVLLGVLGVGGFLVAVSGIVPIKASSGHWEITAWFLNFSKERSVATHTIGKKAPPLDAPWLVLKGAAHYETGCRSCHGSPNTAQPRVAKRMTPTPPPLTKSSHEWEATELFYIVKHGIKLTGMPAWPAEKRDDEVWAMVAFLQALPNMDSKEYTRLATGEMLSVEGAPIQDMLTAEKTPLAIVESCGRCHGSDGLGRGLGAFPKLAGQKPDYLSASLEAYASGQRSSGIMEPIAAGLSDETIRELADYYSTRPLPQPFQNGSVNALIIQRGESIARNGIPSQQVPACLQCHGPNPNPRNPIYPVLYGQYPEYLILQLELFKKKIRGGTEFSHLMHFVAGGLTSEQMSDVAHYFASITNHRAQNAKNQ